MIDFSPARLQLVKEIPIGRGWFYEPKFDGYRGLVARPAKTRVLVLSRNRKDLGRYFPELIRLAETLPIGTVIDGEIVHPIDEGVSFAALQRRLMLPLAERPAQAAESPVAFVAFDALMTQSNDARRLTLKERRKQLALIVRKVKSPLLQLVAQTNDSRAAAVWLDDDLSMHGIEGVVAKRDEPYPKLNVKRWLKVRRQSTMDVLVQGFIGDPASPRLVVGLATDGQPRIMGTTLPISAEDARALGPLLPSAVPGDRPIWAPFDGNRHDGWFSLPAGLIAEVAYSHLDGDAFRQSVRFLRWRLHQPATPPAE